MTMITPFKSYTASLFGIPGKAAVQVKPVQIQQVAVPAVSRAPAAATISASGPYEPYKDPEFVRDPAAAIAKSEAAMAVWQAGEQKFEQENGFRRQVNSMLEGMFEQAKSGNFGVPTFSDRDEAAAFLSRYLHKFAGQLNFINKAGADLTVGAKYNGYHIREGLDEKATAVFLAERQDHLDATRMTLFAETAYVSKALNLTEPLYRKEGGRISFVAQDVTFEGKPLARLSADGFLTRLAPDGTPLTPPETPPAGIDRRI